MSRSLHSLQPGLLPTRSVAGFEELAEVVRMRKADGRHIGDWALRWHDRDWLVAALFSAGVVVSASPVWAQQQPAMIEADGAAEGVPVVPRNSLAIFAGIYTTGYWGRSFSANEVGYEPNYVVAIISSRDLIVTSWGLRIGHESGIALRFGREISFEMWRGLTISYGARLLGGLVVTPRFIVGLSTISNAIGIEIDRELEILSGDVDRLIYLGSEVARSLEAIPDIEVFYRLHHRSGAAHFWGNVAAGHNATGIGIRIRY